MRKESQMLEEACSKVYEGSEDQSDYGIALDDVIEQQYKWINTPALNELKKRYGDKKAKYAFYHLVEMTIEDLIDKLRNNPDLLERVIKTGRR